MADRARTLRFDVGVKGVDSGSVRLLRAVESRVCRSLLTKEGEGHLLFVGDSTLLYVGLLTFLSSLEKCVL